MNRCSSVLVLIVLLPALAAQVPTTPCAVQILTPSNGQVLCPSNVAADPTRALDLAGGVGTGTYYLSLCSNDLVEYLLGVTVVDGAGPDLQVEEVNPNLGEPYLVHVSADGINWFQAPGPYAGAAWAGDSAIDIAGLGPSMVNFVRLTDASGTTTGSTPGPDFDAIVAINYLRPIFGTGPRPYADTVISYNPGTTTTAQFLDPTKALGPPDGYRSETWIGPGNTTFTGQYANFVSLGAGADLVLFFTNDYVVDGPGGDLIAHEYYSPEGNQFTVQASDDGVNWFQMTLVGSVTPAVGISQPVTNNVQSFDLSGTGLIQADYFKIVSTSTSSTGTTPGPDFDAIEAVNFAPKAIRLFEVPPLTAGGAGSINVVAQAANIGQISVTLPVITPPLPAGAGIPVGPGMEIRLSLTDPLLNFVLTDPLAAVFLTGTIAPLNGMAANSVIVTLPGDPALQGLRLTWQSGLFTTAGVPAGASNLLVTIVD